MAEHQFSDLEDSDSDSDLDEDEDEDEESQDEPLGPSSEAHPPGPRATLPIGSLPVQGPQPPDATSGSQATRGSLVSEAEHLAAGSRSMSSQSTLCLPPLGPAPSDPMEKNTGSALSLKAVSPRRPWSPSKEAGSRPSLAHKHSLVKSDSSPQRHSPTREPQASVPSQPGLRTGRLPCGSPRLELSLPMPRPLGRELPPRAHLPAEREGATDPGLSRHSPTGRLYLGQAQSPPQSELPGKWALAGPGSPSAGEHGPGLGLAPRALHPPVPLPHKLLGRSPETCTSLWVSSCLLVTGLQTPPRGTRPATK